MEERQARDIQCEDVIEDIETVGTKRHGAVDRTDDGEEIWE